MASILAIIEIDPRFWGTFYALPVSRFFRNETPPLPYSCTVAVYRICPSTTFGRGTFWLDTLSGRENDAQMKHSSPRRVMALLLTLTLVSATLRAHPEEGWISLFNGKDLTGWTPKIKGYAFGENFGKTFRVQDGAITVGYDGYGGKFDNRFGHLFYQQPFSNYILRVEYRFIGQQLPDGPGWAIRNSGLMLHCQDPKTMSRDQDFPVSAEVQLLGGDGKAPRSTANLCTPGTHVVMNGELITRHCTESKSKTYHGEQWVSAEIEVHGNGKFIHRVEGQPVLEYERVQLDPGDADAKKLIKDGQLMIHGGYISLQSESHPVQFRKVELKILD